MLPLAALPFLSLPPPRPLSEAPEEIRQWRTRRRRSHLLPLVAAAVMAIPFGCMGMDRGIALGLMFWLFSIIGVFWPAWVSTIYLNARLDRALLKAPLVIAQVTGSFEREAPRNRRQYPSGKRILTVFELEVEGSIWELPMGKVENLPLQVGQTCDLLAADEPLAMAVVGTQFWPVRKLGTVGLLRRSLRNRN